MGKRSREWYWSAKRLSAVGEVQNLGAAVEYTGMMSLLKWGLRAPFAGIAILSGLLSIGGVTDWSLGMTGMAFGAVVASAANRLLGKATARKEEKLAEIQRNQRHDLLRGRFENLASEKVRDKAA